MGPDSLRALGDEEFDSLTHRQHVLAHADAWKQQLRDEFDRGWAQGRAEHLNPVLEARIEELEVHNAALRERLAIYERKYGPFLLRRSEESET